MVRRERVSSIQSWNFFEANSEFYITRIAKVVREAWRKRLGSDES